jgi:hypothetical protein
MREYKLTGVYPGTVDLDDPETYKHLPKTRKLLRNLMFREIGYALVYMDYFPNRKGLFPKRKKKDKFIKLSEMYPDTKFPNKKIEINNVSYNQRQRVYALIKRFAENERENMNNVMWYKEMVFLFQDETENMC